jgi:hypothetical protein
MSDPAAASLGAAVSAESESDYGQALDLAAAEVRADRVDLQALVAALAVRLEEALPRMVSVRRRRIGGFRSKETEVEAISLALGDSRFELVRTPAGFDCTRHAVVRGITLRRESRPLAEWIDEVVAAVAASAAVGEQARIALEALIR